MASTDCYKVNIHSYRFCVSYIGDSVSRVGPTRTAYSIFIFFLWPWKWPVSNIKHSFVNIFFTKKYLYFFKFLRRRTKLLYFKKQTIYYRKCSNYRPWALRLSRCSRVGAYSRRALIRDGRLFTRWRNCDNIFTKMRRVDM